MSRIELLYFEGCPSYRELLPRLRALLEREGIEQEIELRRVETSEEAERQRFLGSPTVRIDGEDVDPTARDRHDFGIDCRLYQTEHGLRRIPPEALIRSALETHRALGVGGVAGERRDRASGV
jgi:hypothetical protein